ncbi:hyaluronidase [Parahaliea maris]|uniref:Hyaluronidase n=1 Tax=Parahaliea maris TaxID=2716870 RepID=A0A5C8ZKS5_9GAMM|nr:beta-N-acetylglucosaminidase domain-containing protein [Parahaliea maris]TXS89053.1 hyaluronidase [Parahaliea maris]
MTGTETDPPAPSGTAPRWPATAFLTGIVEGYYGRTWSQADRLAYARLMPAMGLNAYLYCPKADPFLRRQWQQHWPARQWAELQDLAAQFATAGVEFGVGLSPFALYQRYGAAERRQLKEKLARIAELDAPLLAVLFDDMPGDVPDLAERQAEILADVQRCLPGVRLLMCPTYYSSDPVLQKHFGPMPANYWERLGEFLAPEIDIFWTGERVCADTIARAEVEDLQEAFRRPLTLWDNYPVNDGALRSRHLYLEPLPGREAGLGQALRGHFCNPMNQPWLSLPALAGLGALHGAPALPADWMADKLGREVWEKLQADAGRFRDPGLDGLAAQEREELAAEYAALPGAAAAEVVAWLRDEYAFDPACLTD